VNSNVAVRFEDVVKRFGSTTAVNRVTLDVKQGEFTTLLGPSGCGKTTTLRLVAGFIEPDEGRILIKGEDVSNRPPNERNLGMVFQSYALFPHMTAHENIGFGLRIRKIPKDEIDRRVNEALELIQLQGYGDRYPRELSGGQQQRIALARAIVVQPDVLLLDEPLSNLDYQLRQQMRLEIKAIQSRVGVTSIYVTHDQGEALTMSDKIAVMNKGEVVQVGTPVEIYERPNSEFVAGFIGEANFFEGTVKDVGEVVTVSTKDGFDFTIALPSNEKVSPGTQGFVAVRPQAITISRQRRDEKNSLPGTVEKIVYVGSMAKYHVRVSKASHAMVVDQAIVSGGLPVKQGEQIWVSWPIDSMLLFPKNHNSENRGALHP
jgi:spermidine/putrescine ABC transporter ATP-binding subunit